MVGDKGRPSKGGAARAGNSHTIPGRVADAERGARRIFWTFVPATSVARQRALQLFMASTFLSDGGREALRYGALVATVASGGSAVRSALLGAIALTPPTVFGLIGGQVADALPRRLALIVTYSIQAAACLLIPVLLGTSFWDVALLLFLINTLGQVCGPTEQSLAPLVVSPAELASANSLVALASNAGSACGTALIAPVLVATLGVRALFFVTGLMLLLAANRIFGVRTTGDRRRPEWHRPVGPGDALRWLAGQPAVATMMSVAVLTGVANVILQVLGPQYVAEVLDVPPADAVYVFAPSTLGVVLALAAAPRLMHLVGERRCAVLALVLVTVTLVLLGLVRASFATILDPINPLRLLSVVRIDLGEKLRTAGLLAMPLGFGVSLSSAAVQTYLNRRVPLTLQGRAFALQSVLKNGAAIIPLLTFGAIASAVGVSAVLVVSPLILFAVLVGMVRLSEHFGAHRSASSLAVLESFWQLDEPMLPTEEPPPSPG